MPAPLPSLLLLALALAPDAFADVRPGQHYVYDLGQGGAMDEAIVALDARDLTVDLTWRLAATGAWRTARKRVPRDVAWYVKTYRPEVGLQGFGERGYDVAYFRAMMASHPYSHDPLPQDRKPPARFAVPGGAFAAQVAGGTKLARTVDRGCIELKWRQVRATRYPFTLEESQNDVPVIVLRAIR